MASMDAIQKGVARFIDAEILPKLPVDGAKRFGVGIAASVMTKRGARVLEGYKDNEWMNKLGVIDAGGNVDLGILREAALERIPDEGIKIDVPLIGKMTFYRQDVETLYQFIV